MKPSILIGLWATSALVSATTLLECDIDPEDQYGLCDRSIVAQCVSSWVQANQLDLLEQCLITSGCSKIDAATTFKTITEHCGHPIKDSSWRDLRKRQKDKSATSQETDTKTTAANPKTTTAQSTEAQTSAAAPSTTDSPSAAPTTTNSPSTTDTPSSTSATPASTTQTSASSTPSSTMTTSSPSSSTTGPLVCLTTSQMSTTWCLTTTSGASTGSTCIPTFTPIISCAPGLICQTQSAGETTCMVRQDSLTTSGLVVTIIFAIAIAIFAATLFTMCIKSRRASRRQALMREAALVAGSKARNMRDVEASNAYARAKMGGPGAGGSAAASDDNLPLMAAQGYAGDNGHSRDTSADRRPTPHRVPSGSYQDVVASRAPPGAPRLHPGLMGMDADEDDMGYRGGRGRR